MSRDSWRANQKLFLWGSFPNQEDGQQQLPAIRSLYCPAVIIGMACGNQHMLLLTNIGTVYGMGDNRYGQLGRPSEMLRIRSLEKLEVPNACSIRQIACGAHHSIIVDEARTAYGCGEGRYGAVGHASQNNSYEVVPVAIGIQKIACGARHTLAINEYGRAYGWGDCSHGQLGLAQKSSRIYLRPTSLGEHEINDVAAADNITLFLRRNSVFGCGGNHLGQLGLGHKQPVRIPTFIPLPEEATKIWAGRYSICLTKHKNAYFFGSGVFGQLLLPVKVTFENAVEEIFQGDSCGFAVSSEGEIVGWGSNLHGQLLQPPQVKGHSIPTQIPFLKNFSKLACGKNFVIALTNGPTGKSIEGFLDSTLISDDADELMTLRRENILLREKIKELSFLTAQQSSKQINQQRYAELDAEKTRLLAEMELTKKQLELLQSNYKKLQDENSLLCDVLSTTRKQVNCQTGLQFQQAQKLIAEYERQCQCSRLDAQRQKQIVARVKSECNMLIDLLTTNDFMREFFQTEPKSKRSASTNELITLFGSIASHTSKLREIVSSLS